MLEELPHLAIEYLCIQHSYVQTKHFLIVKNTNEYLLTASVSRWYNVIIHHTHTHTRTHNVIDQYYIILYAINTYSYIVHISILLELTQPLWGQLSSIKQVKTCLFTSAHVTV